MKNEQAKFNTGKRKKTMKIRREIRKNKGQKQYGIPVISKAVFLKLNNIDNSVDTWTRKIEDINNLYQQLKWGQ